MPMIAKIVQTAKQMVKAVVEIHSARCGASAGNGGVWLKAGIASPCANDVAPFLGSNENKKAAGQGSHTLKACSSILISSFA